MSFSVLGDYCRMMSSVRCYYSKGIAKTLGDVLKEANGWRLGISLVPEQGGWLASLSQG